MSILSSLHIGSTALKAASTGISTTSHNVANAGTDGYSRQTVDQTTSMPINTTGLFLGQGVNTDGVSRVADSLLGLRIVDATGEHAAAETLYAGLQQVEVYFNESSGTGFSEAAQEFFDALSAATSDPSDRSYREAVVAQGQSLAGELNDTAEGIISTVDGLEESASSLIDEVNELMDELASINTQVVSSGGASGDLLDRRDQIVTALAETVGATASIGEDGRATVYIGGHAAVSGNTARSLSLGTDDDGNLTVLLSADNGHVDVTGDLGGQMGGHIEARDLALGYLDKLNEFAAALADAFNTQHSAGFDKDGDAGGDFFTYDADSAASTIAISSDIEEDADLLAFAGSATGGVGDSDNLASLMQLEDEELLDGLSTRDWLSSLVSEVGGDVAAAESLAESNGAVLDDLSQLRESVSGVDLDEEATKLIEFQAAYQAAARVITATDEMLGVLMQM